MDDAELSCRSVFISDNLGTRGCQAERLLDFIRSLECERLYRPHPHGRNPVHRRRGLHERRRLVESCTALVEDHQGRFSIIRWNEIAARPAPVVVAQAA